MLDCGGTSASGVLGLERMGRNEDGRGYEMATANGWRIVAQMQNRLAARGEEEWRGGEMVKRAKEGR